MSDITFLCPHCDQKMETTDDLAGTEIACPSCERALRIPHLSSAPEKLKPAVDPAWKPAVDPARKPAVEPSPATSLAPHKTVAMVKISHKRRTTAALLCFFLGLLGIHRFYAGKPGTALAQMLSLGGLGLWCLIDFITILLGLFRDGKGRVIFRW